METEAREVTRLYKASSEAKEVTIDGWHQDVKPQLLLPNPRPLGSRTS